MITTLPNRLEGMAVDAQERRTSVSWWLWYLCLIGITSLVGLSMLRRGPDVAAIAWFCFTAGVIAILYQPRYGVYLLVGCALIGDNALLSWYPFVKNFSSVESLLYLNDALIISPAEAYIMLTFLSWLGRALVQRKLERFNTGALFWPAVLFITCITFGLGYGLARGGNMTIALWEARPIYYLPLMLVLVSNLIETRAQANRIIWVAMIALFIEGLNGVWFIATVLQFDLSAVAEIAEHSLSIHENSFIVLVIAAWMYRASYAKRIVLPMMLPAVLLTNFANQRRAGFITLAIALVVIGVLLYQENRKAFWIIVPIVGVVGLLYLGAFWNSHSAIGMPASAIRSVVAPDLNSVDQQSNLYRLIENINTQFTIKTVPLTGVGFGNKFYIIAPMPDISFFIWWEYITHNSILWIWMKAGLGTFLSMIFLVGMAVIVGTRVLLRMPKDDMSVIALTATLYIMMHFIYAYVDMSWDNQSMIYVGTMMGLVNSLEYIVARPVPLPARRWPWQPQPLPAPGLMPVE